MNTTIETPPVDTPRQVEEAAVTSQDVAQYLTFIVGGQEYGVDILRVQEIKGWDSVTRIPNTPPYIKGVLNLRGAIVPIVDLRMRWLMPAGSEASLSVAAPPIGATDIFKPLPIGSAPATLEN